MTEKYTPEKVDDLVEKLIAHRSVLPWLGVPAAALEAVSAELRQEREQVRALTATNMDQRVMLSEIRTEAHEAAEVIGGLMIERDEVQAERDRLHEAITEALEAHAPGRTPDTWVMYDDPVWRILRAALDKEGNDDE